MRTVLGSHGKLLYRRRIQMIEPVFAHTKHNRTITRFYRRGRKAVRTEWRLVSDGNPQSHQAPPPPAHRRRGLIQDPRRSHCQKQANRFPTVLTAQRVARQTRDQRASQRRFCIHEHADFHPPRIGPSRVLPLARSSHVAVVAPIGVRGRPGCQRPPHLPGGSLYAWTGSVGSVSPSTYMIGRLALGHETAASVLAAFPLER